MSPSFVDKSIHLKSSIYSSPPPSMKIINMNPIVFLFYFFFFSVSHSQSTNNSLLTQSQSLQDGQALISPSEIFVLGFVTIGDSQNRYLGMWYNKLPVRSVVWIANRDAPLNTTSGTLTIAPDGNLVLLDTPDGTPIWSTNVSVSNASASTALLMDNGNLILTAARNRNPDKAVWQSFEHPTDNYLPGMTVPLSPRGRRDFIRSWKSETDPSTGNFSLGLDPDAAQTVIWQHGDQKRWRSGLWNGQIFIGVPTMTANYLYGFQLTSVGGNTFFSYTVHNSTEIIRFRMRWDGVDEQLRWDAGRKDWTVFWSQPTRPCEFYNTCGAFGICNSAGTPVCDCFRGFEPRTPSEWGRGNWSAGCRRRESAALQCDTSANNTTTLEGEADWFHELDGLKLPDFAYMTPSDSRQHCSQLCSNNCSCKAYAYVNGIQCLTWSADLIDVQKFGEGGQKLFIRLAASEKLGKSNKRLKLIIILVVVLGTLCLCLSAYMIWRSKTKAGRSRTKGKKESEETKSREFWEQHDADGNQANGSELAMYTFQEIVTSTSNFSSANKLGEGGFGPVYKGKLPCGLDVAVKRLSRMSGQGLEEFKNEIILIAKLQHRNLVRLVGYCVEGEEKVLLYEYLPNRSLDAFIFANPRQHLDWHQRYNIIEGIARGLLYLHRDSRLRIIHRDLKASNILLDEEMNPKISDFGMAKIFGGNQNQANTNRVVGTYGYMAPEYAMEGLFSVKSDVYSFGVLLLEIISGKKNQYRHPEYSMKLIGYAWNLWGEERAMEFIDPSIRDTCSQASALRCINVGLLCVQDSAMDRPIMSTVVLMLESESPILPTPRQPTFTMGRSPMEMELVSMDSAEAEAVSRNFMTNTMVLGR